MLLYPITSKEKSRRVRIAIRHVLVNLWDPIGISDEPNAQDEYDRYIGGIFELLMSNAADEKFKQYLDGCVERMGMDSSSHSDVDVMEALRAIPLKVN
jgi:hypothetical protein